MSQVLKALMGANSETKLYSDDVFQSYVRTGTGVDVTVTTGLDMTKGYMLWSKGRSGATDHAVYDSARGVTKDLVTNSTAAETTQSTGLKSVSSTGHTIGSLAKMNTSSATYVDWVFAKAPKFFDVVTYTGNGSTQTINHSLGQTPGMIIVKAYSGTYGTENWEVYHRSLGTGTYIRLNETGASYAASNRVTALDATTVSIGNNNVVNGSSTTYVAYLFAHDTGTDGMIQCGSFTTDGSGNATVNLGWEPQYVLVKRTDVAQNWFQLDTMRGWVATANASKVLIPNATNAESTVGSSPTATGFTTDANLTNASATYIYLAIRRPNKPPTSGTQVYNAIARTGNASTYEVSGVGFPLDLLVTNARDDSGRNHRAFNRLCGSNYSLYTNLTNAEDGPSNTPVSEFTQDGFKGGYEGDMNISGKSYINHFFRRAPGVFDVVCYTGVGGTSITVPHNLSAAPELVIVRRRNGLSNWRVRTDGLTSIDYYLNLESTAAQTSGGGASLWGNTAPTATHVTFGSGSGVNMIGETFVTYLFATKAGISKVGSYTGNGSSQTINCGFTTGVRFFLVKATSTTGSWWVYDSARGVVSANDPALQLNSTAAEVTSADAVDPDNSGIIVNQEATCSINANGVSYIYLAFA